MLISIRFVYQANLNHLKFLYTIDRFFDYHFKILFQRYTNGAFYLMAEATPKCELICSRQRSESNWITGGAHMLQKYWRKSTTTTKIKMKWKIMAKLLMKIHNEKANIQFFLNLFHDIFPSNFFINSVELTQIKLPTHWSIILLLSRFFLF